MRKLLADYGGRRIYKCLISYGRRLASYGSPHIYVGLPINCKLDPITCNLTSILVKSFALKLC